MGGGLKQAHPCQPWLPWSTAQPLWRAAAWPKARVEARGDRDEAAQPKQPGRRHRPLSSINASLADFRGGGEKMRVFCARLAGRYVRRAMDAASRWRANIYAVREKEVQTVTDLLTTGALRSRQDAEPARGARGCAP